MAVYVVSIALPFEDCASRYAVLHSNSETMFAPVFHELDVLVAHMFAREYELTRAAAMWHCDYSEAAQMRLASDLRAFLLECFPAALTDDSGAPLPGAWLEALESFEDEGDSATCCTDADDLLTWYQDGDDRARVAQDAFHAWQRARVTA